MGNCSLSLVFPIKFFVVIPSSHIMFMISSRNCFTKYRVYLICFLPNQWFEQLFLHL
uniref:Uncharacterized protein n=1 Tax=Solanum lycopersicum TaxID=4081 RepID=A0A3Q7GJR1_SOLLC